MRNEADEDGDDNVDEFGFEERGAALGKERQGGMTVLAYAAGQKHGQRNYTGCVKRYEYQMRAGLRDYAYCGCQQNHKDCFVTDP